MGKNKRIAFYEMTVEMSVPQWNIFRWKTYMLLLGFYIEIWQFTRVKHYIHPHGSAIQLLLDSANRWASDFESIFQSKWSILQVLKIH